MTTVYFVRHGEYENPKGVEPFRAVGYPLSSAGRDQVERVGKFLADKKIEAIFSSPILRCQETAGIIANSLSKPFAYAQGKQSKPALPAGRPKITIQVDERLTEVDSPFAEMEREKYNEILDGKSLYQIPEQLEKGESAEAIVARMRSFLDETLEKYADKVVVAVSHGDPIMLLWCSLVGRNIYSLRGDWPEYIPVVGVYELLFDRGELTNAKLLRR